MDVYKVDGKFCIYQLLPDGGVSSEQFLLTKQTEKFRVWL